MSLNHSIASRFLFASLKTRTLSLFSAVSVTGILCAVMLFFLIDAIINGLTQNTTSTLLGFEAPLVLDVVPGEQDAAANHVITFGKNHPQFAFKFWVAQNFDGLLEVPGDSPAGVRVRSVGTNFFDIKKDQIDIFWFDGFDTTGFASSTHQILIGENLYERLKFMPSDTQTINLIHPFSDFCPSGELEPFEKEFVVAGVYRTGRVDFDDVFVLIPTPAMQIMANELFLAPQIFLFPKNTSDSELMKQLWQESKFSAQGNLQTWLDRNKNLYKAISLEHIMYVMILIFVMIVSSFNLAGVVAIFNLSKAREVAILKTLGLSHRDSILIFLRVGFILGLIGTLGGVLIGLSLVYGCQYFDLSLPAAYGFTKLPLAPNIFTVLGLLVLTPLWCALIGYFPARQMSDHEIMQVLRFS